MGGIVDAYPARLLLVRRQDPNTEGYKKKAARVKKMLLAPWADMERED